MHRFLKKLWCAMRHEPHWKLVSQVPSDVNITGFHIYFCKCQKCMCEWGPRQAIKSRYWSKRIEASRKWAQQGR